jgi:hypothetical protein
MALSYASRMAAAHVSDHTVPKRPTPTAADFASTVYDQQWRPKSCRQSVTGFSVVALNDAHAIEVGQARLEATYGAGCLGDMELVESVAREWSLDALTNHLEMETPAAWSERQGRYARMQP